MRKRLAGAGSRGGNRVGRVLCSDPVVALPTPKDTPKAKARLRWPSAEDLEFLSEYTARQEGFEELDPQTKKDRKE